MYKPLSNRHCQYREMAEKQKRIRRRRSEEQIIKKKVFDQARGKTRVNIGVAFQRWREVRELKGLKTDEELAILLLDSFEKELYITSTYLDERFGRSPPPMSSTGSHRLPERLREDFNMEVQNELEKSTSSAIAKLEVSIDWEEGVSEELDSDTDSADLDFECVSVEPDNDTDGADQDYRGVPEELDINSDGAYPDPEGVPENLDNDTDNADPDHEGVPEKLDNDTEDADADADSDSDVNPEELDINTDSDDPDYTPQMSELQASVRQKRLSSPGVKKGEIISRPVTGLPAPCTEELLRTDISRRIEETLRHPEPEQSSSHEQTQERRPEVLKQYEGRPRLKKNYNCLICGKSFRHNHHLQRHLVVHSGERPFHCPICGRAFTQSGNLKTHMKIHRGKVPNWRLLLEKSPPTESPVTVNVCGECGMDFPQKEQLEEHSKSHKKPYECPYCSKTFKNEYHFKVHKRVHSGDLPFLCKECGKGFITASSLKTHEYTHTGEKNFRCDQCGRAFAQSSQLNMHIRTHTGERPHLCSVCGKSYSKAFDLKVHLRVHTGEKPYMCEKCGKCFYYYNGYRQHLRIHDKKPKPPTKPLGRPKQQRRNKSQLSQVCIGGCYVVIVKSYNYLGVQLDDKLGILMPSTRRALASFTF